MAEKEIGKVTHYFGNFGVAAIEITENTLWVFDAFERRLGHNRLKSSGQTFSGTGSDVPGNGCVTQGGFAILSQLQRKAPPTKRPVGGEIRC